MKMAALLSRSMIGNKIIKDGGNSIMERFEQLATLLSRSMICNKIIKDGGQCIASWKDLSN